MSGGYFDYIQFRMGDAIEQLEEAIKKSFEGEYHYEEKTIEEFMVGLDHLRLAALYLHRIDWLLECDDGEDTFHKRLAEDLKRLEGIL